MMRRNQNTPTGTFLIWAVALASALLSFAPFEGRAEEEKSSQDFTVTEYVFRRLEKAQKALENKKYGEAIKACGEVLARSSVNDYERALAFQTRAYIYVDQGKLPKAVEDLKAAADLNALPGARQTELIFNVGQVLLSLERPKEAIVQFAKWTKRVEQANPDALYTVGVAYAQVENFAVALKFVEPAIRSKGRKTPTNWKELQLACLVQLKRWNGAIDVMSDLVEADFTNETRWKQLSALYAEADRQAESVAVLEAMFYNDLLRKPEDIMLLARNLLASNVPTKSARILEKSMAKGWVKRSAETLELLGTAYVSAADREEAVKPLMNAANMSKSGRLFMEAGQLFIELKRFDDAARTLRKAIAAGGLRQTGQAYVLLGVAEYRQGRIPAARAAFGKAAGYKDGKSAAKSWLSFLSTL